MDEFFDFEAMLPRALADANLLDFQQVLEQAEAWSADFSPRYRRSRLRLLNDPAAWLRRRLTPPWKRVLRGAACVLLTCAVALGGLMAASPAVRAAVLHWVREFTERGALYRPVDQGVELPPSWRPAWLPEGWYVDQLRAMEDQTCWVLCSRETAGDIGRLTCICYSPGSRGVEFGSDETYTHRRTTVQGVSADYYENGRQMLLFWESPQGHLLSVSMSGTDRDTLQRIAESMMFYDRAAVRYEVGWLPGEDTPEISHFENTGAGQFEWFVRHDFLTFQYITDPPCALSSPEREAEEVTVNGLPARFWPCERPEEETGNGHMEVFGGVQITSGVAYSADQAALLLWEDPETNSALQICGVLEKDEMLRMAESIRAVPLS